MVLDMVLGMVLARCTSKVTQDNQKSSSTTIQMLSSRQVVLVSVKAPKGHLGSHAAVSAVVRPYIASIKVWRQSADLQGGLQTDGWHQLGSPL